MNMTRFLCLLPIRLYQLLISPVIGPCCRYQPSCSEYGAEAFARHGTWHGFKLTWNRILRCHPWGGHGFDPVPEIKKEKDCNEK